MPSLPLFGSESSPVAPATCCRAPLLVQHPCRLLSGATTRSTTRPPPLKLDCLLVAIIAYPYLKRHRSFHAPTVLSSAAAAFFEPDGLLVTTVRCRAQLPLVYRPPLAPDCLLVAPTTYFTSPLPLFQPKSSLLPPLSVLSSAAARSVPPPLPLEPDYSLVITATSYRAPQLVQRHYRLFSSPIARSTLSPVSTVMCCRAPPLFSSLTARSTPLPPLFFF